MAKLVRIVANIRNIVLDDKRCNIIMFPQHIRFSKLYMVFKRNGGGEKVAYKKTLIVALFPNHTINILYIFILLYLEHYFNGFYYIYYL